MMPTRQPTHNPLFRTLVVHTGGIGDFLLALPTIRHLAKDGSVELLGRRERLDLAVAAGIADKSYDLDQVAFHTVFSKPAPVLKTFLARFQRAIVWMNDEDHAIKQALSDCGIANVRVFPGLPPENWTDHASRYYLQTLDASAPPPARLVLPRSGDHLDIAIHPGSGGNAKNWPIEHFYDLTNRLLDQGRQVHWILGPAEEDKHPPQTAKRIEQRPLVELGSLLTSARCSIGNDSGITHLAAAVGCPTVAIFGPTNPHVWAPVGEHVRVLQGTPWPTVEEALRAIASLLTIG